MCLFSLKSKISSLLMHRIFFSLSRIPLRSIQVIASINSLLRFPCWITRVPWCRCTTACFWRSSGLFLVFGSKHFYIGFCVNVSFPFSGVNAQEYNCWVYMIVVGLVFKDCCQRGVQSGCSMWYSHWRCVSAPASLPLWVRTWCYHCIRVILVGMWWYLLAILICVSLIIHAYWTSV